MPGALPALIMGVSIGWLVGLSVSETVASTVAALLALVGGIGASLITVSKKPDNPILNLWPMALLGLGIALGATAGLYTRLRLPRGIRNTQQPPPGNLFSTLSTANAVNVSVSHWTVRRNSSA